MLRMEGITCQTTESIVGTGKTLPKGRGVQMLRLRWKGVESARLGTRTIGLIESFSAGGSGDKFGHMLYTVHPCRDWKQMHR